MESEQLTNSVVYTSKFDRDGRISAEIVTGLLYERIFKIGGGDAGICGLSESGVYDFDGRRLISGRFKEIAVGGTFHVGISSPNDSEGNHSLYSWGTGEYGELGLGPMTTYASSPSRINYVAKFVQVASSLNHSLAVDTHGNVFAWGQNFEKQLGLYTKNVDEMKEIRQTSEIEDVLFTPRFTPMSLRKPVLKVACGHSFSAVVTKTGEIWTWGAGESGQLGYGRCTFRELPGKISVKIEAHADSNDLTSSRKAPLNMRKERIKNGVGNAQAVAYFSDIACGAAHVLALTSMGTCYGWGMNKFGQLGVGDTVTRYTPSAVEMEFETFADATIPGAGNDGIENKRKGLAGAKIRRVYAYSNCSASIDADGLLYSWGSSHNARLMRSGKCKTRAQIASFNTHYRLEFTVTKELKIKQYSLSTNNDTESSNRLNLVDPSDWDGIRGSTTDIGSSHGIEETRYGGMAANASSVKVLRNICGKELSGNNDIEPVLHGLADLDIPSHYVLPEIVTALGDQMIHSFAFSRKQSAVLINTSISALYPAMGPLKCFSSLCIFGEGFWDSDKIVVKFTLNGGDAPPRSTTGKLCNTRELVCRPPKLQEAGIYTVSVSMDGNYFLAETLTVRIYKEMNVESISPSLIDLRSPSSTHVAMSIRNLKIHAPDEVDHEGIPLWPCESDLVDKFSVKLHVSCSPPSSQEPIISELVIPGRLKTLPVLEYDTVLSGQNSVVSNKSKSVLDETNSVSAEVIDPDIVVKPDEGSTTSISVTNIFTDLEVLCDVNFSSLGPAGSLIMIRGSISINGQDFCTPSSESSPIICHSFSPSSCTPLCRPLYTLPSYTAGSSLIDNGVDDGNGGMLAKRLVTVLGSSFIPINKLPTGMNIEAVIRGSISIGSGGKSKNEKVFEKNVQVTCSAADRLSIIVPTLDQLLTPGTSVLSYDEGKSDPSVQVDCDELPLEVYFQLVNTATVATASRTSSKPKSTSTKKGSSPNRSSSGRAASKNSGSRGKKESSQHQYLSDVAVNVHLYRSQPIVTTPKILRRLGDTNSLLTIEGQNGGFAFASPDAKVVFFREDLNLCLSMPLEDVRMVPIDTDNSFISSWISSDSDKAINTAQMNVGSADVPAFKPGQQSKILIKRVPPLFMPAEIVAVRDPSTELLSPDGIAEPPGDGSFTGAPGGGNSIVIEDGASDEHGEDEQGGRPGIDGAAIEQEGAIPLDFIHVKVLLDGESDIESLEHCAMLTTYTSLVMSDDFIEVPKGGAVEGTPLRSEILMGCVPSEDCVVRLRDSKGKYVDCSAQVTVNGNIASPASLSKFRMSENAANTEVDESAGSTGLSAEPNQGEESETAVDGEDGSEKDEGESVEGMLDTGGLAGSVSFDCPDLSSLEPVADGKEMLVFVDISLNGGASFDTTVKPLLQVKV